MLNWWVFKMWLLSKLLGKKTVNEPFIRVFVRTELPDLMRIDALSFDNPITRLDYDEFAMQRRSMTIVADVGFDEPMAAYMMVVEHKHFIQVVRMAVHPEWRGCQIGSRLLDRVIARMNAERRRRVVVFVPETLVGAQKFFHANKFVCTRCVPGIWCGEDEPFLQFEYKLHPNLVTPFMRRG